MKEYKISKIEPSQYKGVVYNIEVEEDHSYVTSGFVVHNCQPNASKDIYFDRAQLESMPVLQPVKEIAGFKMFKEYKAGHAYAGGHDVAGGVELDSSASVFIDFSTVPAQVVATFASNTIAPEAFGDEVYSQGNRYGGCLIAIENNKYDQAILKAKQLGAKLYMSATGKTTTTGYKMPTQYGWNTNSLTKTQMFSGLREAVEDGLISLNDKGLIQEAKSYTRNNIIDRDIDARLTTRHFDLLTACFIKDTLILTDNGNRPIQNIKVGDFVLTREGYKKVTATVSHMKPVISNIGLTGTANHPVIMVDNSIKELTGVNYTDILYIWNEKKKAIESMSYTEAQNIIDIQNQNIGIIGFILRAVLLGKSQLSTYIGRYGRILMGKYQKDLLFTTKTITNSTTTLATLRQCHQRSTCVSICKMKGGKNHSETILAKEGNLLPEQLENPSNTERKGRLFVLFVGRILKLLHLMQSFVQKNARGLFKEKKEKRILRKRIVLSATNNSKQEFHTKKDAQKSVVKKGEQKNLQEVFNLTVEDQPEYFSNNVLVHNCAIAWQMKDRAKPKKLPTYQLHDDKEVNRAI